MPKITSKKIFKPNTMERNINPIEWWDRHSAKEKKKLSQYFFKKPPDITNKEIEYIYTGMNEFLNLIFETK